MVNFQFAHNYVIHVAPHMKGPSHVTFVEIGHYLTKLWYKIFYIQNAPVPPESLHARTGRGLLQDTVRPMGVMLHYDVPFYFSR
jgi:hypothetical protein